MRRALLVTVASAALLLGGCGIPDNTDVVPLRPGPSPGVTAGGDLAPERSLRTDSSERAEFVENYLEAAAGDFTGAADRVKQFLSPDAAATFKAPADIKVVRAVEDPLVEPGSPVVSVKVREVGTLGPKGILVPATNDQPVKYEFNLRTIEGEQGLFVTKAPPWLLLSDEALERFYAQRTIYFWNQERTGLVPDVRYLPLSVPLEGQPTTIMDWLTSGPAPWLAGVVEGLPEGTARIGNVPAIRDNVLQISLSDQAVPADDPGALDRLQKQLRWSLRPNLPATLELSVAHQAPQRFTGTDYLAQNSAYRPTDEVERFVVYAGQVRRLARSSAANQPVPVIPPAANKGVRSAALATSGSRSYAALTVGEAGGKQALRVGAAGVGEQATMRRIALPAPIGRPVWARSPVGSDASTYGLVTANGRLYSFRSDGTGLSQVEWPGGPSNVTAVAVAPDAHRLALLAGGRLYVAALSTTEDGVQLSEPHVVRTVLHSLTAVDWGSEGMLVLAGTSPQTGRVAMMDVSIDGASQTDRLADLGSNPVTHLATLPADPTGEESSNAVAYVLNGAAYDEVNPDRLEARDLAEPPADPPADVLPGAPFFLT